MIRMSRGVATCLASKVNTSRDAKDVNIIHHPIPNEVVHVLFNLEILGVLVNVIYSI